MAEHDTWITVDPIVGCPASCDYCYLGPRDLRRRRPVEIASPDDMVSTLVEYLGDRTDRTPVAIGNYTDMAMTPRNRQYLVEFAAAFADRLPDRPLVVISKSPRLVDVADDLAATRHPVVAFLSYSFSGDVGLPLESGPTMVWQELLESFDALSGHRTLRPVHFWRPFVDRLNPVGDLDRRVAALAAAGSTASVVVGFKTSDTTDRRWSADTRRILTSNDAYRPGQEFFPHDRWEALTRVAASREYAVYRNSSCGMAKIFREPDALRSYEGIEASHHCLSTTCLPGQRAVCASAANRGVSESAVRDMLAALPVEATEHGHSVDGGWVTVNSALTEEDANRATHTSGLRVRPAVTSSDKAWINFESLAATLAEVQ